jgi:hypothetical protein
MVKFLKTKGSPAEEGAKAAKRMLSRSSNPFSRQHLEERDAWFQGFDTALDRIMGRSPNKPEARKSRKNYDS